MTPVPKLSREPRLCSYEPCYLIHTLLPLKKVFKTQVYLRNNLVQHHLNFP